MPFRSASGSCLGTWPPGLETLFWAFQLLEKLTPQTMEWYYCPFSLPYLFLSLAQNCHLERFSFHGFPILLRSPPSISFFPVPLSSNLDKLWHCICWAASWKFLLASPWKAPRIPCLASHFHFPPTWAYPDPFSGPCGRVASSLLHIQINPADMGQGKLDCQAHYKLFFLQTICCPLTQWSRVGVGSHSPGLHFIHVA